MCAQVISLLYLFCTCVYCFPVLLMFTIDLDFKNGRTYSVVHSTCSVQNYLYTVLKNRDACNTHTMILLG